MDQQYKMRQFSQIATQFKQDMSISAKNKSGHEQFVCQNPQNFSFGGKHSDEVEIGQFLKVTHQRINLSAYDSGSEIVEQISFDWDEEGEQNNILEGENGQKCRNCEKKQQVRVPDELIVLSEIRNLEDFLKILELINADITRQMEAIISENNKLRYENGLLKYKESKSNIKIQLYQNQLKVADKKYAKLLNDVEYLTKQKQQLSKSNRSSKNLKVIDDQLVQTSAKVSLFCKQNCCNKVKNNENGYSICQKQGSNVEPKVHYLSPPIKIQLPKSNLIQQGKKVGQGQKQLKIKITPSKSGSTKISGTTKNSFNTKRLSVNHSDYNFIVSSIFRHKYCEKREKQKGVAKQNI